MASRKKPRVYAPVRDPRTGRFTKGDPASVKKLAKAIASDYKRAVRERNRYAKKRRAGAKLPQTLARYTKSYRKAAEKAARLEQKVAQAQKLVPPPKRSPRLPKVIEVGLSYQAAKGSTSDVNINVRISRKDGRGVTEGDAKRAILAIASDDQSLADDLRVSGVEWQRPTLTDRRGSPAWRKGNALDVWSFQSIFASVLFVENDSDFQQFRFGHVKEDEL